MTSLNFYFIKKKNQLQEYFLQLLLIVEIDYHYFLSYCISFQILGCFLFDGKVLHALTAESRWEKSILSNINSMIFRSYYSIASFKITLEYELSTFNKCSISDSS